MTKILYIETATKVCSVALSERGKLVGIRESTIANSHSEVLSTFVEELIVEQEWNYNDLDAIAVSKGPGSYTGLRIGISSAKGLCYALEKPLISVSTLQSMAKGMLEIISPISKNILICPMIDARRMEVYSALFDTNNKEVRDIEAQIINNSSFDKYFENHILYFAGDGADKCKETFSSQQNAHFLDEFEISSKYMIEIATEKFENNKFENIAYFEPYYLKDFIAGKSRVKGLE